MSKIGQLVFWWKTRWFRKLEKNGTLCRPDLTPAVMNQRARDYDWSKATENTARNFGGVK